MSDAAIEAAIASFNESGAQMDNLGNTVVSEPSYEPESTSDVSATPADSVSTEGGAADPNGDAAPVTPEQPPTPQQDEIDKLLAAEGISAQSIRGENRIPYSRTKKIIENAQLKWKAEADKTFATEREQYTSRLSSYEQQERVANQDPDRFIQALASVDPRYQKFLKALEAPAAATPAVDTDPEPQPLKDEQGNPYYTPEGWKDWQAWTRRQAVKEAKAEFEKTYGKTLQTVQQREQAAALLEARRPVVAAQMQRIVTTYGADLVDKHQDAIVAAMQAAERAGTPMSADAAAAQVLIPLMRQDEATIRTKVLAEMNKRPAAAKGAAVPAQVRPADQSAPQSLEDKMLAEINRVLPRR